jgi:hypothetical protein
LGDCLQEIFEFPVVVLESPGHSVLSSHRLR